jgi:hypothetical protein
VISDTRTVAEIAELAEVLRLQYFSLFLPISSCFRHPWACRLDAWRHRARRNRIQAVVSLFLLAVVPAWAVESFAGFLAEFQFLAEGGKDAIQL